MGWQGRISCLFLAILALIVGIYSSYAAINLPLNRVGEFQLDMLLVTLCFIIFAYLGFCFYSGAYPLRVVGKIISKLGGGPM